ncbi:MAG: putative quinol monooxygenase [Planctomycetota bacterium]
MPTFQLRLALFVAATFALVPSIAAAAEELHPIAADTASQLDDTEKPFVLVVDFTVPANNTDAFIKAVLKARRATVKEPGNVAYQLSRDAKDATHFLLYERWKSVAALDFHLKQPYLVELLAEFEELLPEGPKVTVMKPVKAMKK